MASSTPTMKHDGPNELVPDADKAARPSLWDQLQEWGVMFGLASTHLS